MTRALDADAVVVGGGPAGLSAAIRLRERGLSVVVVDRAALPADKACGEGLMPAGLRELESLGARALIDAADCAPFAGIRYLQEDGAAMEARFAGGQGLGARRTALAGALQSRAAALGADFRRCAATALAQSESDITLTTDAGELRAALVVGADGLHSFVRRAAGLDGGERPATRFGLRRHFARAAWSDCVEVHWQAGCEAYVTPVGPAAVNVAFLWDAGALAEGAGWDALLARFPALRERLEGAPASSESRGAGPLWQPVRAAARGRVALVGDAAGYVDAITGQGLSLAMTGARLLAESLPTALGAAELRRGLARYRRRLARKFAGYALPARLLLWLASRPELRRRALALCARQPWIFRRLVSLVGKS